MKEKNIASKTDRCNSLRAEEYLWETGGEVAAHTYIFPALLDFLEQAKARRVLDFGCGNGQMTEILSRKGFEMVGVDPSVTGIEKAKESGEGEYYCLDSADKLPENLCQKFDAVISTEVIEHMLLPRQLFERAEEALSGKGGRLILSTPYHGYLKNLAIALTGGFDMHWHPLRDYGHVKFFSVSTLQSIIEESGFVTDKKKLVGRVPPFAKSMVFSTFLK